MHLFVAFLVNRKMAHRSENFGDLLINTGSILFGSINCCFAIVTIRFKTKLFVWVGTFLLLTLKQFLYLVKD